METKQDIKIIPIKPRAGKRRGVKPKFNCLHWVFILIIIYFILILIISLVPLSGFLRALTLILGTLLIFDILHSAKWYVKNNYGQKTGDN